MTEKRISTFRIYLKNEAAPMMSYGTNSPNTSSHPCILMLLILSNSEIYFSSLNQGRLYEFLFPIGCSRSKSLSVLHLAIEEPDNFPF